MITGGVNYMLFSVKLVGDYDVGVYICRRRIVTKHMRNTSKAYVHSTQGLIMFSLLWYNQLDLSYAICICIQGALLCVIIFLFVFVYVQHLIRRTPKLNVFVSSICECHTFISMFKCSSKDVHSCSYQFVFLIFLHLFIFFEIESSYISCRYFRMSHHLIIFNRINPLPNDYSTSTFRSLSFLGYALFIFPFPKLVRSCYFLIFQAPIPFFFGLCLV